MFPLPGKQAWGADVRRVRGKEGPQVRHPPEPLPDFQEPSGHSHEGALPPVHLAEVCRHAGPGQGAPGLYCLL